MKISSTLLLLLGSFLGAVSAQQITADIRYTIAVESTSESYYGLACNDPYVYSNHPMSTEACDELAAYVKKAEISQETIATALHNALTPDQPVNTQYECGGDSSGETNLNIIFGEINTEIITNGNEPGYLKLKYSNECIMKIVAEQANLAHLIPFSSADGKLMKPLP